MVELVDTRDLKSLGDSLAGSIPAARTSAKLAETFLDNDDLGAGWLPQVIE